MKQKDREFWSEHILAQKESGLSVKKFCAREGLIESKFYYWKKTIGAIKSQAHHFIKAIDEQSTCASFTITLSNSMSISFDTPPEPRWFGKFLKACSDATKSSQI